MGDNNRSGAVCLPGPDFSMSSLVADWNSGAVE